MVPGEGIEPTLPCGNQILSLARLPISPPRRWEEQYKGFPQSFQHSPASNDTRPEGTEVGILEIGDRGRGPRAFTLWCRFMPWSRVPSPYPLPRCLGLDDRDARAIRQFFRKGRSIQDRCRVLTESLARRSLAEDIRLMVESREIRCVGPSLDWRLFSSPVVIRSLFGLLPPSWSHTNYG